MRTLIVACAIAISATASAQTAEETVTFMLFGFEKFPEQNPSVT
jgi:hypothetical protein